MQIAEQKAVTINYTLTDSSGAVLDQSQDGTFTYLHGQGNIIPGLEKALAGKQAGDNVEVAVPPQEAYGERDESLTEAVPKNLFKGIEEIRAGMRFQARGEQGQTMMLKVVRVEEETVHIDANHPLAGVTLNFSVDVIGVRDATQQELEHGHSHGAPGHDH